MTMQVQESGVMVCACRWDPSGVMLPVCMWEGVMVCACTCNWELCEGKGM